MEKITKASKRYVLGAHTLGLTVAAIIKDLYTYGHEHVTKDTIGNILQENGQFPKFTYLWHNYIAKATNCLIPMGVHPWSPWSSRFILISKTNNETNGNIFTNMRRRGSDIPAEHWVKVVLDEHQFIENELGRRHDTHDDATLHKIIVMAHNWGYTLPEFTRRIFGITNRTTFAINVDKVNMTLQKHGIPEAEHRNGRMFGVVAEEFILSAYKLGMDVDSIQNRMYVHGFDHPNLEPIFNCLRRNCINQGQILQQGRPNQASQPMQPRAYDNVRSREGRNSSRSAQANEEPSKRVRVSDLLN